MSVAREFERERFCATFQPNLAAHDSFDAIVYLAAHRAVVNSECHESRLKI
jgi:hypothetical protein